MSASHADIPLTLAVSYYEGCRAIFPGLVGVVSRGPLEDVLPGFSDLDLRLLCDGVAPDQWQQLDEAVFETHSSLVARGLEAKRLLLHPPAACLLLDELATPRLMHAEARLWDWCAGTESARAAAEHAASLPWSARDEASHLRRYVTTCTEWKSEGLPDNSCTCRDALMRFFLAGLESACCLIGRCRQPGRLAALRHLAGESPDDETVAAIGRVVSGEESPHAAREQCLAFCGAARALLAGLAPRVASALGGPSADTEHALAWLCARLEARPRDYLLALYDAVRFSRVRRASFRYLLSLGDEHELLVRNELATLRDRLVLPALLAYCALRHDERSSSVEAALERLAAVAPPEQVGAARRLSAIATGDWDRPRPLLAEAAELYALYHLSLEAMLTDALLGPRR